MGARETSLNNAELGFKYWFGPFFCGLGLFLFNRQHPYCTGLVCLDLITLGAFFLSVTRDKGEFELTCNDLAADSEKRTNGSL
jgi:hypothetical protein